jgi:hypothetical protein
LVDRMLVAGLVAACGCTYEAQTPLWPPDVEQALERIATCPEFDGVPLDRFTGWFSQEIGVNVIVASHCWDARVMPPSGLTAPLRWHWEQAVESAGVAYAYFDHAIYVAESHEAVERIRGVQLVEEDPIPTELAFRLTEPIDFSNDWAWIPDLARALAEQADITIVVAPDARPRWAELHVRRMPLWAALVWLARVAGTQVRYEDGAFRIGQW